jgi:hypothetical protein
MKLFLGGTCPQSKEDFDYRTLLIPFLKKYNIDYFNPVVEKWTEECIEIEENEKEICDIHLYVITYNMKGVYSIAETFDSYIRGKKSILIIIDEGFDEEQLKSLNATTELFGKYSKNSWHFDFISDIDEEFVLQILLKEF